MTKKLLVPSAICILVIAFLVMLFSKTRKGDEASSSILSAENTHSKASSDSRDPGGPDTNTKREREDSGEAMARRELEKEFDELLPAQFPEQFSSLCDVILEPGESLVLGGFRKPDGNYEFTMMAVEAQDSGELKGQYKTKATTMVLSPERTSELGFDALVSPARTRIQKSLVVDPRTIMGMGDFVRVMTGPYLTAPANTSATLNLGTAEGAHAMSVLVTPLEDGDSIRLRTRIESPLELP